MLPAHLQYRRYGAAVLTLATLTATVVSGTASATPLPSVTSTNAPAALSASSQLSIGGTPLDGTAQGTTKSAATPPAQRQGVVPGQVLVTLNQDTSVTGPALSGPAQGRLAAHAPQTSDKALDAKLRAVGATSLHPLFPTLSTADAGSLTESARGQLGADAPDLSRTYVVNVQEKDSTAVASALQGTSGVAYAEPDRYVNTMNAGPQPLPTSAAGAATTIPAPKAPAESGAAEVPSNYAVSNSAQAFLNAGCVNAMGAFTTLQKGYGQQPGAGEIITNVSIGDLTDQSMADAGDNYVKGYGPTTVLKDGRRYLDLPSMPLIPTYVAGTDGSLDPAGSTKNQDPGLGEVLLDFSVMAPLPHDQQREDATGSGYTDLLGIAPGAGYRLVVPQEPTIKQIAGALLAAAHQTPRPSVITASLGFGTDSVGFPGRYLEDDPYVRSVVASIVKKDGIVVSISSNDGTRLYTPAAVGPDGGSTPTDKAANAASATTIDDVALTTTPSKVPDSGAIAAGGTTLDDTLAVPANSSGPQTGTYAETRISGFGTFSSGFGSRLDLSAPSDNIIAFQHPAGGSAQAVTPVFNGGTSASAPMVAAAAAVVLQAGRLAGHRLSPQQVREVLKETGRAVQTPPQIDRKLQVGPQIDVTAATEKVLGGKLKSSRPSIVRLSVAHRVTVGGLGGTFLETTDQNRIDLGDMASGGNGEGLVGPVTFAADVTGLPQGAKPQYRLTVGKDRTFSSGTPSIRVTPRQLLSAAGLPVISTTDRSVDLTFEVLIGGKAQTTVHRTLAIGPSDGRYVQSTAPLAPATAQAGKSVTVSYDLTGVTTATAPELVVSTVGHWNPSLSPIFSAAWHQTLTSSTGTVTIPADAFKGGGGLYGIGIALSGFGGNPSLTKYGEFAAIRIAGGSEATRPDAPTLAGALQKKGVYGYTAEVTRTAPAFELRYDVRDVPGARSAIVEFSAPAPTLFGSLNTFTNANGSALDHDGVNTPSIATKALSATSGTVRLNVLSVGLATSATYSVRVLALDNRQHVIGQASPVSNLVVNDGLAPDGSTLLSFIAAGKDSIAALRTIAGGTEVRRYSTATGTYGAVLTSDPGAGSDYHVIGVAPESHRVLLGHATRAGGDIQVETWDTVTGTLIGSSVLRASEYRVVAGRVDAKRNRAAVLVRAITGNTDSVLPVDLADGTVGTPILADGNGKIPAGTYSLLDIDQSTGTVFLGKIATAFICLGGVAPAKVDLDARTVTTVESVSACGHGIASDGAGTLYNLAAGSVSTKIAPTTTLTPYDEATQTTGDGFALRKGAPSTLAVDGIHHIALVSFAAPEGTIYFGSQQGTLSDNNATSQVAVVDLTTGKLISTLNVGIVTNRGGLLLHGVQDKAVQLDPATRTAWTYSPDGTQLQQFSY
ncbi:S8 family serine peptidase [Streptomyces sp. SID13031]|uniref:S8 family serine peptidase n=1 Tax=Streptomyces sp. SID13031 TaxID=2706046 RepID=UPI0013CC24CE|nr:S8 family serine peptidase [Streptomyces sp. SID13031]NEA30771.1 S8 family serine peptidase [Streptomyces sp. SID13031]